MDHFNHNYPLTSSIRPDFIPQTTHTKNTERNWGTTFSEFYQGQKINA